MYLLTPLEMSTKSFRLANWSVADLGEGPGGPGPPLFVEYLQKIYKKVTEMSIQKPF